MRWAPRFMSDELWLRSRRVLLDRLRDAGLDTPYDEYCRYLQRQHEIGMVLIDGLARSIGTRRWEEMGAETFLGTEHRRFTLRLPFILAFGAEYASWLARLVPRSANDERIQSLAALFNLGIVLVDQLADDPVQRGDITQIFGAGRLERLLADTSTPATFRGDVQKLPTPELRVLGSVVSAFFTGVHAIANDVVNPGVRDRFVLAIGSAYRGQLAASNASHDEAMLRAKSVTPFVVPPLLYLLGGTSDDGDRLVQMGQQVGEVFWRVDDLVDVGRDFATGDGNIVLLRAGIRTGSDGDDAFARVLDGRVLEELATEAMEHARCAIGFAGEDSALTREVAQWLEMYIVDWMG
jgi:hypothetical protein